MSRNPGNASAGKTRPNVVEKRRQSLELRKAGATFDAIARQVGYSSPASAYKAVIQALRDTCQEPADDVRRLELERLDRLMLAHWPAAIGSQPDPINPGQKLPANQDAAELVLKITDRRAKLLGLDVIQLKTTQTYAEIDDSEPDVEPRHRPPETRMPDEPEPIQPESPGPSALLVAASGDRGECS